MRANVNCGIEGAGSRWRGARNAAARVRRPLCGVDGDIRRQRRSTVRRAASSVDAPSRASMPAVRQDLREPRQRRRCARSPRPPAARRPPTAPRHHPRGRHRPRALGDDAVRAREEPHRLRDLGLGHAGRPRRRGRAPAANVTEPGSRLPARPSASVSPTSIGTISPAASAVEIAGERSASTATTRASRRRDAHSPRPDARLPPPSGAHDA